MIFVTYDTTGMVEVNGKKNFFQPQGVTTFDIRQLALNVNDDMAFGVVLNNESEFTAWKDANPGQASVYGVPEEPFEGNWQGLWTVTIWNEVIKGRSWSGVPESFAHPYAQYEYMITRLRQDFYERVDARTRELIGGGFEYPVTSGQFFSLSAEAQRKWTAMYTARNLVSYPVFVVTADEQTTVELSEATDVQDFFTQMVNTVREHIDTGRVLKNTLRDLSTVTEYDIIDGSVDER
jgi:hypothetical protein